MTTEGGLFCGGFGGFAAIRTTKSRIAYMPDGVAVKTFIGIGVFLGANGAAGWTGGAHMQPVPIGI